MEFHSIPEALADLKRGRLIVVVDDKSRENEGDVVFAANTSTPAKIKIDSTLTSLNGLISSGNGRDEIDLSNSTGDNLVFTGNGADLFKGGDGDDIALERHTDRVDGGDGLAQQAHAALHELGVWVPHLLRGGVAEQDVELGEAEDERVLVVD